MRIVRQRRVYKREYKLRVRVALYGVAEEVRAHCVVGVDVFIYPLRAALVDLEHGVFKLRPAAHRAAGNERRCDARVGV